LSITLKKHIFNKSIGSAAGVRQAKLIDCYRFKSDIGKG